MDIPTKENLPISPITGFSAKGAELKTKLLGCSVSPLKADWNIFPFFTVTIDSSQYNGQLSKNHSLLLNFPTAVVRNKQFSFQVASQSVCSDFGKMFLGLGMKTTAIPPPIPSPPCISPLSPGTLTTRSHCQTSQMQHFVLCCSHYVQNKEIAEVPSWSIFLPYPYWNLGRRFTCSVPISFSHRGQGEPILHLCHFTRSKGGTTGSSSAGAHETLQSSQAVSQLCRKKEWIKM